MSSSSLQEQGQPAADGAETQDLFTADGVPIAQLQESDKIYFRSNAQGPWGVYIFLSYDPTKQSVHLGMENSNCLIITSLSHCSVTRPTKGVVLGMPKEQQAYALDCSIEIGQMLKDVSESCKQGIQILLKLELAGVDPKQFFTSLTADFPRSTEKERLGKGDAAYMYTTVGTYIPVIIESTNDPHLLFVRSFGSSVQISRQFICSELPEGKRACVTPEQFNAFCEYAHSINTEYFRGMPPAAQHLMLAALMRPFLNER